MSNRLSSPMRRISSRKPRLLAALAAGISAGVLGIGIWRDAVRGEAPWLFLAVAAACACPGVAALARWKSVMRGDRHIVVSGLFEKEAIPFDAVCLVVKAGGVLWDKVRIHFNRPTRFGWSISFVPVRTKQSGEGKAASDCGLDGLFPNPGDPR